jgi:ArsR family transcriptional regulator
MTPAGVDTGLRLARLAKAVGHPARVAILHFLRKQPGPVPCTEIVSQLPLAQSTVSAHLRILVRAGLVVGEAAPPRVRYRLDARGLAELKRLAAEL